MVATGNYIIIHYINANEHIFHRANWCPVENVLVHYKIQNSDRKEIARLENGSGKLEF